jgi:tight adherence protein B
MILSAGLFAMMAGLLLASPVDAAINRLRLRKRLSAVPRRDAGLVSRSTAAPILRVRGRATDAVLARWLPGGAVVAARLAAAGDPVSLTMLMTGAGFFAVVAAIAARLAGLPAVVAAALVPALALVMMRAISGGLSRRARAAFSRGFPDAVAVMIRSLRAGLPVTAAVAEVARGSGPVAAAFAQAVEAMQLGQTLETALWSAARAIGIADFDFLVVTIALQRETGGNLAETLAGLDDTLRNRRQLAMKVRAMAAEARASAMIIGSLPFAIGGLLWATSPAYLLPLFTTTPGQAMLGAGLASIAVGGFAIGQMMQVEA